MQEEYRLLVDEQLICGLQVHVGLRTATWRCRAQRVARTCRRCSPLGQLALLARHDTGYASIRTLIWQRWPTAGTTGG